ncbi:MAG: ABC transporter permease subunit [Acidocella sp.]|nr:ABC transporter permease subunit [Acidocella sp.]
MSVSLDATLRPLPFRLGSLLPATLLRRAMVPAAIVALWQWLTASGLVDPHTMPAPAAVAESFWQLIVTGQMWPNLLISVERVAAGLTLGVAIGTALGLVASLSRVGEDAIDATVQMARTLPHLALIPLMILWFGIGETPKVILIALGSMFPIYLNLFSAVRGVERKLVEAVSVLGLSRAETIWHVILPATLPGFLVGLRQAFGISWISLVVAEQINASSGIGYLVMNARDFLRTDIIFDGLLVYALLGLGTDLLVRALERKLLVWRPSIVTGKGE